MWKGGVDVKDVVEAFCSCVLLERSSSSCCCCCCWGALKKVVDDALVGKGVLR